MAFMLQKDQSGKGFEIPEVFPSTASETYVVGEILTMTSGALTKAAVDTDGTQLFVCDQDYVAPATLNKSIAAYRIKPSMIFKVLSYADNSSTVLGTLVTAHTDLLQVTATSTKGICQVLDLLGDGTATSKILVRFPTTAGR